MESQCTALHPTHPPVALHPSSPSACVRCALSTVTNSKAIYTRRRSACITLTALSGDLESLCRLGVSFLSDLLHDLLRAALTFSPSEAELAEEVSSICTSLACCYDSYTEEDSARRLSTLLFAECTAAIMLHDSALNVATSITLLARLCEQSRSQQINLPFESLPEDFIHCMLSCCVESTILYSDLNLFLEYALQGIQPNRSRELLEAASSSLPTPRDPNADRMFLTISSYISEANLEVLLECDTLPVVLKTAFMSSVKDLREKASKIIVKISDEMRHAKKLHETAVFEYIVESLRVSGISSAQVPLLYYSAIALSALAKGQGSEKWVYSLDVVLSVAPHLKAHIEVLEPAVCAALREAPTVLFSNSLIEAVVAFTMQMLAHEKNVTQVMEGISSLLTRIRPNVNSLHAFLTVLEGTTHSKDYLECASVLVTNLGSHFIKLTMQTEIGSFTDDLARLGRLLSFAAFETRVSGYKENTEAMNTLESATSCSADLIACRMDMFTTMLNKGFLIVGAYDLEYWRRMVSWCWHLLPPRVAFAYCLEVDGNSQILNSTAKYCQTIISEEPLIEQHLEIQTPVTEEMFLTTLATDPGKATSSATFQLLRRAVELRLLENVCQPELVIRALKERLSLCFPLSSAQFETESVNVFRLLSQICSHYGLVFPKLEIPETVLVSMLTSPEFSFSCEIDCLTFLFVIREEKKSAADVAAWEIFADHCKVSVTPETALSNMLERMFTDDSILESAIYAIVGAKDPIAIADCLLCIADRIHNTNLGRTLEQVGAVYNSCQSLRDIESAFSRKEENRYQSHCRNALQEYNRNVKVGTSFLILFSETACMSDSRQWRTLTRAVCDVFVLGAANKCRAQLTDILLTACLNYLIALTPVLTPGKGSSLQYIWQNGIVDSVLQMLSSVSQENKICDRLMSAICSFLLVILTLTNNSASLKCRHSRVIANLQEGIHWNRILSSFPFIADLDVAVRITKCCFLLKHILSGDSGDKFRLINVSYGTLIALAASACSVFDVLRDAALDLLESLFQADMTTIAWQTCLAAQREISHVLLQKLHDNTIDDLTEAEFNYLREALRHGHMDKYLLQHRYILPSNITSTSYVRTPDQEQSNISYRDKVIWCLEQRKVLVFQRQN